MKATLAKKKHKPSYDFSKLSNSFSNPELWEDTCKSRKFEPKSTVSNTKTSISFQTPYIYSNDEADQISPSTSNLEPNPKANISVDTNSVSTRAIAKDSNTIKNTPRGKCRDWIMCAQCSILQDCGTCRHCLDKSLR